MVGHPADGPQRGDREINPRIGHGWRRRGRRRQEAVPTPGQNQKHYLAGALHAHTGSLVWVEDLAIVVFLFLTIPISSQLIARAAR